MKMLTLLLLLSCSLSFAQTRTHPGGGKGPDVDELGSCVNKVEQAKALYLSYLKLHHKNYKKPTDDFSLRVDFEKLINQQSLNLSLAKPKDDKNCNCDTSKKPSEREVILERLITIYEDNQACLDFQGKIEIIKQMKEILAHERKK